MFPPSEITELLTSAYRPPLGHMPSHLRSLLDRLEAVAGRAATMPGALSDKQFRRELEQVIPELQRFARSLTRDADEAADLVQDTMLKAWRARARYQPGTSLRAWTFVILRNLFLSEKRRARFKGEWDEVSAAKRLAMPAAQEARLHVADVDAALQKIGDHQRQALLLVALHDMSHEEVSMAIGVPVGTVKSRVSRGRAALEAVMEGRAPRC